MAHVPSSSNVGAEFYNPKVAEPEPVADGQDELNEDLTNNAPVPIAGDVDPNAPNILKLVTGSRFVEPFVVTLMRKTGNIRVLKTDAGSKSEDEYELCYETVREPADLLRLVAGVQAGSYKHLNNITIELQLMLYLAAQAKLLESLKTPERV